MISDTLNTNLVIPDKCVWQDGNSYMHIILGPVITSYKSNCCNIYTITNCFNTNTPRNFLACYELFIFVQDYILTNLYGSMQ